MMQKDEKLENSELLTSLESQLWHSFDILRKENVSSDNYHIILFLTLLHKEGFLNGIIPSKPDVVKDLLEDNIEASKGSEIYKSLFQAFKPVIDDISNEVFYKLVLVIDMLDQNALAKCLPSLVDNLIHKISKARSRYGEEYIQPYELTKLLCELADMPEGSKVYNPYAGLASFGIELNGGQDYLGQEINRHIWAIGLIRLLAHNRSGQTRFLLGDSVHNWNPSHEKFDLIIATPPFGMRLRDLHDNQFGNIRFADHLFLLEALESLTPKGKIVAVVPQSILFRIGAEEYLRRRLIEQDLLETVISFPGGIFSSTAISVAAVIINKEKSRKGSCCFVDASKFVKSDSAREKRLDYKSLITSIVSGEQSDVIKHVSSDSIRHFKYNLDVPRYLLDQVEGVPLGELAVVVRGIRVEEGDVGRFVRIRDLSDDRIDYQINSEEVEPVSVPRNVTRLAESALLL
ncbi:MAG: HsdM family class I SAM-dependent methyltransferase, partial [Candidatus Bathyarchaeia archaeon]